QAGAGRRHFHVTGVQTCALPISSRHSPFFEGEQTYSSMSSRPNRPGHYRSESLPTLEASSPRPNFQAYHRRTPSLEYNNSTAPTDRNSVVQGQTEKPDNDILNRQ